MNKQILISCFLVVATASAQIVDFRNNQTDFPTQADRDVYCLMEGPIVGTNWQARLLYGSDAASLQPATYATPARFRNVTAGAATAGTWQGGNRTLAGFSTGQTVTLQVQVWDSTGDLTFDQARASGRVAGTSDIFQYTIPAPGSAPTAYYMNNFRSFAFLSCIPEPSVIAFGVTGLAFLFLFRKRRV